MPNSLDPINNSGTSVSLKSAHVPSERNFTPSAVSTNVVHSEQAINSRSSTIMEMSQYASGWVDKAKILTNAEFIQKLKANLK